MVVVIYVTKSDQVVFIYVAEFGQGLYFSTLLNLTRGGISFSY
jgi:hypothetical protein